MLPESDLAQFVGLNLEPLTGLATFADISEGFTLGFAEVNFASDRERLLAALRQRPECQAVQFQVLRLTNPQLQYVLEELKQIVPTIQVEPGKKLVLVLCGLENAIGVIGEYPPILADLNFVRDILAKQVPHPMIFVLPDYAMTRVARYSHDFWAWSSGVFIFRTDPQTLDTVHTQMLQEERLYTSDAKPVKQERIDLLQRLLMEYAPTGRKFEPGQAQNCLNILLELGNAYCSLSDYHKGNLFYQQALTLAQDTGNQLGEANTLRAIGDVLQFLDQRSEALSRYDEALLIFRQVGARLGEANTLKAIGDVLQFLDQRSEALSRYDEALLIYRQVGDRLGEANTLKAIGDVLQFLDQRSEALSRYDEALLIYRQVGARLGEANTLNGLGNVYRSLDQIDQAIDYHRQALNIHQTIGALAGEAFTLWALGKDYDALKQYPAAIEFYQQSLQVYRQIGDRFSQAVLWQAIGDSRVKLNQIPEARIAYQEARTFYLDIGMEENAQECHDALNTLIA